MNRELAFASLLLIWAGAAYGDDYATDSYSEPAEDRVGRIFWARAALSETSVDFFRDLERRERIPVREKRRFQIVDIQATDRFPHPDILYRVRFDSQEEAYIGLDAFENLLYREPKHNQAVTSVFQPPGGVGVHVYIFERSGIFGARSTVITSQLPIEHWHEYIADPTLADAILDRLLHSAHQIHLEGESMRKRRASSKTAAKPVDQAPAS